MTGVKDFYSVPIDGNLVALGISKIPVAQRIDDSFLDGAYWNLGNFQPAASGKVGTPVDVLFYIQFTFLDLFRAFFAES